MLYFQRMRRFKMFITIVCCVLSAVLAVTLILLIKDAKERERLEQERLSLLNEELRETFDNYGADTGDDGVDDDTLKKYDLYQKLNKGLQVNALFLGNGAMTNTSSGNSHWVFEAVDVWKRDYGITIQGGNYARVDTGPFYGYTMFNEYPRGFVYDIIVLSYGAKDDPEDFALYYDGLLRSIKNKNAKCEIYCIIEANADGYSKNADTVRTLCDYYGGVCIDMIKYFEDNNISYADTLEGINPTAKGSDVYLKAFTSAVNENVKSGRRVPEKTAPYSAKAECFDKFTFAPSKSLTKLSPSSYEYETDDKIAGIMYYNTSSGGTIRIYVNGVEVKTVNNKLAQSGVRKIAMDIAGDNLSGRTVIRIEAGSADNLTNIAGIATCDKK